MKNERSGRAPFRVAGGAIALAACARSLGAGGASPSSRVGPNHGDEPPKGPLGGGPTPDEFKIPAGAAMPTRRLGTTGIEVSAIGIGGFHLGIPPKEKSIRIVVEALDHGVTFLDNCWDYNGGESERRMGVALQDGYRDRAFLMTKLDGRTADPASKQLDQSLGRLRTDRIDLVQIHEVILSTDPARVFSRE